MTDVVLVHRLQAAGAYQERAELDRVAAWWREDRGGVCALVGLGGAGKTALAERFLRLLADPALPQPDGVFVYSFYEQPIAEVFFSALHRWLGGEGKSGAHFDALSALKAEKKKLLLVLDGLERVQNDGSRGGVFGEVDDTPLRELIVRAANGMLGNTALLVTTRFPLVTLERATPAKFLRVDIEALPRDAAIALLRSRGAAGAEEELAAIADRCGRHALLVDLAGAYLGAFGSEPALFTARDEEVDRSLLEDVNPAQRGVLSLQLRFARVAERYKEQLLARDSECWTLLRLACLFRNGVRDETLFAVRASEVINVAIVFELSEDAAASGAASSIAAAIAKKTGVQLSMSPQARELSFAVGYTEQGKLNIVALTPDQLRAFCNDPLRVELGDGTKGWIEARIELAIVHALRELRFTADEREKAKQALAFLAQLGLIDARDGRVLVHPAIRESVVADDPEAERAAHRRTSTILDISTNLGWAPLTRKLMSAETEEIIHHLLGAGDVGEAWSLYQVRAGGYLELGTKNAAYARGEAMCRMFVNGAVPSRELEVALPPLEAASFFNEWGLYLHRLGQLDAAAICFQRAAQLGISQSKPLRTAVALQNLGDTETLRGRLPAARSAILAATDALMKAGDDAESVRAEECVARESRRELLPHFIEVGASRAPAEKRSEPLASNHTIEALLGRGELEEAEQLCRLALIGAREYYRGDDSPYHAYLALYFAELAREMGENVRARGHWTCARAWAMAHGERELLARVHLEDARLLLAEPSSIAEIACREALAEGMLIAADCGYGLAMIDLLIERATLEMRLGRGALSQADLTEAKRRAADPACGYSRALARAKNLARPMVRSMRARDVWLVYQASDSHWMEPVLEALDDAGLRARVELAHRRPEPARGRIVVELVASAESVPPGVVAVDLRRMRVSPVELKREARQAVASVLRSITQQSAPQ